MQFNNIINFSNAKIFNKQIKYNGIGSLNYVHDLNSVSVAHCLTSDYEIDIFAEESVNTEDISEAAVFEDNREYDNKNTILEQLRFLKALQNKKNNINSSFSKTNCQKSFKIKSSIPTDQSSRLLRQLVNATGQFEVTQVMSSANRALITMRMAIAMCDNMQQAGSIRSAVKKLEKIINRCEIKSRQLKEEEDIRLNSKKAEKNRQEKLREKLKNELNERIRKRKVKEAGWLREISYGTLNKKYIGKNNKNKNADKEDRSISEEEHILEVPQELPGGADIQTEDELTNGSVTETNIAESNMSDISFSNCCEISPVATES